VRGVKVTEMKYWLYFIAKLLVAIGVLFALQYGVLHLYPISKQAQLDDQALFMHDMAFTFLVMALWHLDAAVLVLIIVDQRRRCRTCLHKLIMPVSTGSWGRTLLGRPRTERICPYGHGTLTIEDLQITGRQLPDWQPHDGDIWKELESYYQARK
jgi:hypothetical protein